MERATGFEPATFSLGSGLNGYNTIKVGIANARLSRHDDHSAITHLYGILE